MLASLASLDDVTGAGKIYARTLVGYYDFRGGIYGYCLNESGSWIILKVIKS